MSIHLDEYRDELVAADPALAEHLDTLVTEAARHISPAGLKTWLDGALALARLGRGGRLATLWLEEMPLVAREVGEDVIPDVMGALLKMASMVSGEVLALVVSTLPAVARRLGDADLLRGWLQLLHRMSARAPRGIRPMLGVIDELLARLTLSGLRRWVDFGAEAYRRDFAGQRAYFALETEDSKAVLQKERRGTLFIDVQRKINFYLRAFWGRDFFLRPAAADLENFRPFVAGRAMHLPDAVDDLGAVPGLELYRAMAAHMAAHLVHSEGPMAGHAAFSPAQRFMIGLLEDARVEWNAMRAFPGMGRLWRRILAEAGAGAPEGAAHEGLPVIERIAAGLLDGESRTGIAEIDTIIADFHEQIPRNPQDQDLVRTLGLALFDHLSARHLMPSLRILESIRLPWRDDNRLIWSEDEEDWLESSVFLSPREKQVRRQVNVMEFVNEVDVETAGDDAQEIWTLSSELFPYEDHGISFNEMEGKDPVRGPFHHDEWDWQVQLHRPAWVSVWEHRPKKGDPAIVDGVLTRHRGISHRIRQIVDRLRPQGLVRERKLEDGDVLDINAAVDAMVMLRMGLNPDPRITMRYRLNRRDLAVTILIDLSESTNDPLPGATPDPAGKEKGEEGKGETVLDLTRDATALLATAIDGIGDPFAVHGFNSNGREDVRYYRFKDFDEPFGEEVKARLAGMTGGLSTRMGAAMRHAGALLARRPEKNRLLLLVTDGEPADIDVRDPGYLRQDTKKAVEELRRQGISSYCLTLDPEADAYVSRIFGPTGYTVIDNVRRLPERLPTLFAALTR